MQGVLTAKFFRFLLDIWRFGLYNDNVKALPGISSNEQAVKSNEPTNQQGFKPATICALIRRMRSEINALENTVSILKRDVARIDRKQYKDAENSAALKIPGNGQKEEGVFPAWAIPLVFRGRQTK